MKPLVVVEGPRPAFDAAVASLRAQGWEVREGFDVVAGLSQRIVCTGEVSSARTAQAAVLAAVRGAAIVAWATAPRDVLDVLCDDLRRVGTLDHRTADETPGVSFTQEQIGLLRLLAGGLTLGEAASRLHLSRRTADRRLHAARVALGVQTTTEAIMKARQRGLV